MFRTMLIVLLFFGIAVMQSCSDDISSPDSNTIIGSGNLTTIERTLPSFHSIQNNIPVNLTIQYGDQQHVSITVDDNVADYINTSVDNGRLKISSMDSVYLDDITLSIDLTMTDLREIYIFNTATVFGDFSPRLEDIHLGVVGSGTGTINLNLNADRILSFFDGPFNVVLTGQATKHMISHYASGSLMAFGLNTDTTYIRLIGTGNEEVFANDYLNVEISGTGSIYYKGYPDIDIDITGTGNVIDANP